MASSLRSFSGSLAAAPTLRSIVAPTWKNEGGIVSHGGVKPATRVTPV
jgi:hypothetical protein